MKWMKNIASQYAIFQMELGNLPDFIEVVETVPNYLMVKTTEEGSIRNPFIGDVLCTISNIEPLDRWIKNPVTIDYSGEPIRAYVNTTCRIEWADEGQYKLTVPII
jgi:hypothetical protein